MDWQIVLSTFGFVFVAELGDKTQLAVVSQTCKYRAPWAVFLGASGALLVVTALGVLAGRLVGQFIPEIVIRIVAGLAFVVMGGLVWRDAVRTGKQDAKDCECSPEENDLARETMMRRAFGSTFVLLFLAELGDKTQLAVLGLTGQQPAPWSVFAGSALALTAVTALGVVGGQQLCRLIPESLLLRLSAILFVVLGGLMLAGVI